MRERGKKKEGQRNVIPPQIFNGQEFRGVRCGHCYDQLKLFFKDFEDFDIANEDDVLEEFLGLERSKPKVPQLK